MARTVRVVVARLGMDAHWRGSVVVARALRDAGMEVVYLGNQTPEAIADTAAQEAADVVGLSSLSGNHLILAPRVVELLRERGMSDTPVVLGGAVPPHDVPTLEAAGVARVFGPGSPLPEIVAFVAGRVAASRGPRDVTPPGGRWSGVVPAA
ncbi:MAG: cobalamin B12-binding domain-containing protein, partial [Deferrisomatales bacterium]